jgi:hypothetical protein
MGHDTPAAAPVYEPMPSREALDTGPGWNLAQRVAFRFALVYFVLYILPFPVNTAEMLAYRIEEYATGREPDPKPTLVSEYVTKRYAEFWDEAVLRTGREVFGVDIQYRPAGSGDTTWNYVQIFDYAGIAAALTLLWTLAAWGWWLLRGRSRLGYPHLHEWLRVYVRFYVASKMILYGAIKVIKLQFAYPAPDRWLETFGESSPMRLLWTFMGASDEYTWFTGAGELVAGLLLCTRRTTLLGAMVTFGVMLHVAALNFCYDVPVKLFSSHLVLMSVFLMLPDLPWLFRALVLGQPVTTRGYTPLVNRRWLDWTLFVIRSLAVVTYTGVLLYGNWETSKLRGRGVPEPPMFGLWEVEEFAIDGKVRPPLTTDAGRWQRLAFRKPFTLQKSAPGRPGVTIVNMPGKPLLMSDVAVDEEQRTITLSRPGGPPGSDKPPMALGVLRYTEPEPGVIEVEGEVAFVADGKPGPKSVKARLRHYGKDRFLLSGRGFHWINEFPYNQFGPRSEPPPKIPPPPKRP